MSMDAAHGACRATLRTDLGFSVFDAEFYALFDGVIFKIDVLHFLKYALFLNALGRTVANEITDSY